ncbi:alpha/beta hydrolase [bacterium]|nr:alpha/beta hydrolase [bacterium]
MLFRRSKNTPRRRRRRTIVVALILLAIAGVSSALLALSGCSHAPIGWEKVPGNTDIVPVLFVTDRAATNDGQFGPDRAESLSYGVAWVTLPPDRETGEYPRPVPAAPLKAERHVALISIEPLSREGFLARLDDSWSNNPDSPRLLFVPGYGLTFESAACRLAQMADDIDAEPPVLFSWPSHGSFTRYARDHRVAADSVPTLQTFLEDLATERAAGRFGAYGVAAHSTGAEILSRALAERHNPAETVADQAIFFAPDVDAGVLAERTTLFTGIKETTIYASTDDVSLWLSRVLHGNEPRGGEVAGWLDPQARIVDVSDVTTQMWGHIYYRDSPEVLSDLRRALTSR